METSVKPEEKLEASQKTPDEIKQEEKEHYQKMVELELDTVSKAKKTAQIADSFLPPVFKEDEYGNTMPHILIDGVYVPEPIANVSIQERKLVMEYHRLEELKEEADRYVKVSKKAKVNK